MSGLLDRLVQGLPKLEPFLFPVHRGPAHRIAIVLMLVAVAFAVRQLIGPPELGVPFLTFFPAAAISAVFGGFWAGMLATALGSIAATYFFIPPYSAFSFEFRNETVFGNLVYLLDEIVVCSAIAALHRFYRITKDQNVKLHTLIQTIPDLIWLKSPDGIYLECNPAVEQFFGLRRDSIIGHAANDLFVDPVAKLINRFDSDVSALDGPQTNAEWVMRARDGKLALLETTLAPMHDAHGALIGVLGIARDITLRRMLENEIRERTVELELERTFLSAIFEHTGDGIMAVSEDGCIVLANQEARRYLEISENEPVAQLTELWPEWAAIASSTLVSGELRCEWETGGRVLALSVTRAGGPRETRYVIVARDVSDDRRLNEERRELDRQMFLMEKKVTLGELAMGVAHEIGNPLAGMKAVAQSLQYDKELPVTTHEALARLESEIDRLASFLRSFHGFAAPQPAIPEGCCLRDIIDETLFWTRKEASSHNVVVSIKVDRSLFVYADQNQIKQVLLNLVVNAIYAMPGGGELGIAANLDSGNMVRIEISDTGHGIGADVLPRIFDPFFTTRTTGSGLGLAIVRKIVSDHEARIDVRSKLGHGSCFTLYWPVIPMEQQHESNANR